jgi:hypothetical protein
MKETLNTHIFNPLIHGTNSTVLAMLPHTQMKITSTVKMLNEYGMAPLFGEAGDSLFGGGLGLHAEQYISFGRMNSSYEKYGLDRVINSYAGVALDSGKRSLEKFRDRNRDSTNSSYDNINTLLVFLSRAKLQGTSLEADEREKITESIMSVIQYHYFLLLLVKHVRVDQASLRNYVRHDHEFLKKHGKSSDTLEDPKHARLAYDKARLAYEENMQFLPEEYRHPMPDFNYEEYIEELYQYLINDKFREHFKRKEFLEKILEKNIDLKDIYENPTPENLQKILVLLDFSKTATNDTRVDSSEIQYFTLADAANDFANNSPRFGRGEILRFYAAPGKEDLTHFIENVTHGHHVVDVACFEEITLSRAKSLEDGLVLMDKILDSDAIIFSESQRRFIDQPFPIILICDAEDKVHLLEDEYRAHEDLMLGTDITMIATDTPVHQIAVMDFLAENKIDNVQVILIEQLRQSQKDGIRPVPIQQPAEAIIFTSAPLPQPIGYGNRA